jgi:hypothetical protein
MDTNQGLAIAGLFYAHRTRQSESLSVVSLGNAVTSRAVLPCDRLTPQR